MPFSIFLVADGINQQFVDQLYIRWNYRKVVPKKDFAPFFHPDGKRIVFSSNYLEPRSGHFDLFTINPDGTGLERITTAQGFDSFPMWSPDGRKLLWASERAGKEAGEINIFIADWIDRP